MGSVELAAVDSRVPPAPQETSPEPVVTPNHPCPTLARWLCEEPLLCLPRGLMAVLSQEHYDVQGLASGSENSLLAVSSRLWGKVCKTV